MALPMPSEYAQKRYLIGPALRREVLSDNGERVRRGMALVVDRFASNGNLADGQFIRDTLDGKPKQQLDISSQDNGLQSLQVMFVQAIAGAVAEQQAQLDEASPVQGLTVEMEKISNESSP